MPDEPEPEEKSIKRSVSFPPALLEGAQSRADSQHGGNLSRYVQFLIQADLTGQTPGDRLTAGAHALNTFAQLQPGNYSARLHRAVADGRPFADIAMELTGGDPELLVLARQAYDFLAGNSRAPALDPAMPPAMSVLFEIRDLLKSGAALPRQPQVGAKPGIPNSPVNQILAAEKERRAAQATSSGGNSKRPQSEKALPPKPRGEVK